MWREDESQKPDEAKKTVFSNNCTALQRENDKEKSGKKERVEYIFPKHLKKRGRRATER